MLTDEELVLDLELFLVGEGVLELEELVLELFAYVAVLFGLLEGALH